jgi:hypothetical protein
MLTSEKASRTYVSAGKDEAAGPAFSMAPRSYGRAGWHETPTSKPPEWRSSLEMEQWCLSPAVRPTGVCALLVLKWSVAAVEMQVNGRVPLDAYI